MQSPNGIKTELKNTGFSTETKAKEFLVNVPCWKEELTIILYFVNILMKGEIYVNNCCSWNNIRLL